MEAPTPIVDWNRFYEDVKYTLRSEQDVFADIPVLSSMVYQNDESGQELIEDIFDICPEVLVGNSRYLIFTLTSTAPNSAQAAPTLEAFRGPYSSSEHNIFLRMQELDEEQQNRLPLYKQIPSPDNLRLPPKDTVWFEYFYRLALSWDSNSIPRFVPGLLRRMYGLALSHYALRQALMSQSAGYHAILHQGSGFEQSRRFVAQLLPVVQTAISSLEFDEGHLCAVFQLVKIYSQLGDIWGAHRHLQGLHLMIDYLLARRREPHPLVMCIYRGAIYFDIWFAFEGIPFAFPSPIPRQDDLHRKWLADFVPSSETDLIDVVLAQFELDDLEHRVMTLLQQRQSTTYDPTQDEAAIKETGAAILGDLETWKRRPIIEKFEAEEINGRKGLATKGHGQFLHYPPLIFGNEKYALLLISFHSLVILASLLIHPEIGPSPYVRFTSAITLCRILAFNMQKAITEGKPVAVHWHTHDLLRAGLVLGEPMYPLGNRSLCLWMLIMYRIWMDYR